MLLHVLLKHVTLLPVEMRHRLGVDLVVVVSPRVQKSERNRLSQ